MKGRRVYRPVVLILTLLTAMCFESREAGAQTVPLKENHPHAVSSLVGAREAPADKELNLRVYLALRNRAELDALLAAQQNPSSPQYRHWLSPQEFAKRFGPRLGHFKAVARWLKSQGFVLGASNESDRYIELKAPVWQIEQAFGVTIVSTPSGGDYGNLTDPVIPAQFEGIIVHIDGLDNLRRIVPLIRSRDLHDKGKTQANVIFGSNFTFGPNDFYSFYDETALLSAGFDGSGDCIGLVEESNFRASAVTSFNQNFSLPQQSVSLVLVDGTDPGTTDSKAEGKALLDIEWSHVAAPGAAQVVYIGDPNNSISDPITDAVNSAVQDDLCGAISISKCGEPASFYTGTLDPIFQPSRRAGSVGFRLCR